MSFASVAPPDRVQKAAPGAGFDLFIFSMYEKPGWQARTPGSQTRPPHPGSTVEYQGQLYEVLEIGAAEGSAHTYRYALRKWEDRFIVRRIFPYSAQSERAVARQIQERRARHRRHSWITRTFPISTQAPSPIVQRWQNEWGLPMYWMSLVSGLIFALPMLVLGRDLMFFTHPERTTLALACFYIGLEQGVRVIWIALSHEPQGSPLLTALWIIVNPIERSARKRSHYLSPAFADEVRPLKEQPWDLEVHTIFRDPVLLGKEPVSVEGEVYRPLGYIQQGAGLYRRYVFRLKQLEAGAGAKREYTRQRTPEALAALIDYEMRRDHTHRWALLYGLLPAKRQLELEGKYDFLSAQATSYSAALMLGASLLKLVILAGGRFDHGVAAYFAAESLYRLALAQSRGEPCGSLFGWLLLPFLKG